MAVSPPPAPSSIDLSGLPPRVVEAAARVLALCREELRSEPRPEAPEEVELRVREATNEFARDVMGAVIENRDDGASRIERDGQSWFRVAVTPKTIMTSLGPVTYRRARYRSGASGASPVPVDESLGLVDDYLTRPAAELGLLMMGHCTAREDPAGFGLLALSRRGCTLRWRLSGGDPSPGCRLVLEPAHFLGCDAAHVVPDDSAPWPHGTAVTFEASEAPHSVRAFLETAARHYPLPVTIGGEVVERRAFLDGALHVEPWKGLVFGVFKDRHAGYRVPDVNFHGLTLPVRLPQVDTVEGGVWSARADTDSCPDLELVLPARKEAVETPFLEDMREAARLAVYRAMAQADPAPRVAWTDWHKAKEAGIEMPEPPTELRPWRPAIADTDYWDERSTFTAVGSGALVMQADPEPPEAQTLHRALGLTRLQGESTPALRLFAAEPRFEGYRWYDALARVTGIENLVTVDGAVRSLDYFTSGENGGEPERPETVVMHLNVLHPPKSPRHCFRKCGTIAVPADLAFAGEAWSSLHDALPLVTADSGIAPEELARLLRAAFFSPSDDAEADSWETQLTRFEEEALHMSLKLMCSVEEARQRTIADAVWREIFWLMPRDRTVTIVVRSGKVSVDIGPVCTEAATDAGTGEAAQ